MPYQSCPYRRCPDVGDSSLSIIRRCVAHWFWTALHPKFRQAFSLWSKALCSLQKRYRRVNMVQILCTHVCKWKNDSCWNDSRNEGRSPPHFWRMVERVNSNIWFKYWSNHMYSRDLSQTKKEKKTKTNIDPIYLIYCKNFCKCLTVPPLGTTIKQNNLNIKKIF
jgi:hypothetical protein